MDHIVFLRVFWQNLTPFQYAMGGSFILYLLGLIFFSDRLNNKANAVVFTLSYIALALFAFMGYQLLQNTLAVPLE